MEEYISLVESNVKDKKLYSLAVRKVEGVDCDYKLTFKKNETYKQFYKLIQNVITVEATSSYDCQGEGGVFIMHLRSDNPKSKYVMLIEASEWFENNKDKIVNILKGQATAFKTKAQEIQDLKEIEDALNSGSYTQIICDMIKKYASKMSKDDLYQIQTAAIIEIVNKKDDKYGQQ